MKMKNLELANDIELEILAYLQRQTGFCKWWETLPEKMQGNIEEGIINATGRVLDNRMPFIERRH